MMRRPANLPVAIHPGAQSARQDRGAFVIAGSATGAPARERTAVPFPGELVVYQFGSRGLYFSARRWCISLAPGDCISRHVRTKLIHHPTTTPARRSTIP